MVRARFEIAVEGSRPWQVTVTAQQEDGGAPHPGIELYTQRIRNAIHERLKRYAAKPGPKLTP